MKELITIFEMDFISIETKIQLLIKSGGMINHQYGMNLTEPVVAELINILNPNHEILKEERYSRHLTPTK